MAKKQKCPECPPVGAPGWMATFSDLCTLLLCFFVLLISMASFETNKFKIAARSLQGALGILETYPTVLVAKVVQMPKLGGDEQKKKLAVKTAKKIEKIAKEKKMDKAVKVKVTDNGIAIKLSDPNTFPLGKSNIRKHVKPLLKELSTIIRTFPDAQIRVEGHTDNSPIKNKEFPSNWELSASRALNVVKYMAFAGGIDPARMSGVGYGEYRPVAKNDTKIHKQMNRRIEIYVEYLKKYEKDYRGE